jgi:hypothetical protein
MQSCVQSGSGFQGAPSHQHSTPFTSSHLTHSHAGLILGDVLFRTHVVMFDASDYPNNVVIGIGKQNPSYTIGTHISSSEYLFVSAAGQRRRSRDFQVHRMRWSTRSSRPK